MLLKSFKVAGADKILAVYLFWFFLSALMIWIFEPHIKHFGDSIWFCFASATSIGYGDVSAITVGGRIVTILLSLYSIAVIAIITAVITGFFMDLARLKANDSVKAFISDLEHLPEMSKEELEELSQKVKEFQKKH